MQLSYLEHIAEVLACVVVQVGVDVHEHVGHDGVPSMSMLVGFPRLARCSRVSEWQSVAPHSHENGPSSGCHSILARVQINANAKPRTEVNASVVLCQVSACKNALDMFCHGLDWMLLFFFFFLIWFVLPLSCATFAKEWVDGCCRCFCSCKWVRFNASLHHNAKCECQRPMPNANAKAKANNANTGMPMPKPKPK